MGNPRDASMSRPRTPLLAVDLVIRLPEAGVHRVVLIERRNPPPGWALPGGFVDLGETTQEAAVREAREETALQVRLVCLLGCYSDPSRDPRGHTASVVYVADGRGRLQGRDDARRARLVELSALGLGSGSGRSGAGEGGAASEERWALAFDHRRILEDYLAFLETGMAPQWRLSGQRGREHPL